MTSLQIAYAFTHDKLPVSPQVAKKGQDFSCPICERQVVLRRGDIRQPHFAHKPDTGCSGEGVRHKVAKQMIYRMYRRTIDTPMISISVVRKCPNCSQYAIYMQGRAGYNDNVKCEVAVGKYRVDIALFRDGKPTYGIEVRDTHPVDEAKWVAFKELEFPCIEVEAKDVMRLWEHDINAWKQTVPGLIKPMRLDLKAIKHNLHLFNDQLPRVYCNECDQYIQPEEEEEVTVQETIGQILLEEMDRQGRTPSCPHRVDNIDTQKFSVRVQGEHAYLKCDDCGAVGEPFPLR